MKQYDFDELIERRHTDCFKWDALKTLYGRDDLQPMWVADMDFRSPDFVMEAIRRRCDHEVLGYTMPSDGYWKAVTAWLAKHYSIDTTKESLHFIPGIVAGIAYALLCFTQPGDRVLVTTPPSTLADAVEFASFGAVISMIGIAKTREESRCSLDINRMHFKRLQLRYSFAAPALFFPLCIDMIKNGLVDVKPLISHRFPLEQMDQAMLLCRDDKASAVKVMMVRE